MTEYTEEQLQQLRDRWKGHEEELKALVPVIRENPKWETSEEHKSLTEALGPLPEGIDEVERDLRGSYLRGASLAGANLQKADLSAAVLEKVDLSNAFLVGACLSQAFLEKADLSAAVLERADLSRAFLEKACLSAAILERADLSRAFLAGAYLAKAFLAEANLSGANLWGAGLTGANLWGAALPGVNLWGADLSGANLENTNLAAANLENANLSGSKLRRAYLSGAFLENANLSGADLQGAKLYGAHLVRTDLSNTKSWVDVKWNPKDRHLLRRKALRPSRRKTVFEANDLSNANWRGAALLRRYVEDENYLNEYIRAKFPWWRRLLRWLWKWSCDYGRSFKRWALVSFVLSLLFGLVLLLMRDRLCFDPPEVGDDWVRSFYLSVSTFTRLGFSRAEPLTRWAMLVIGVEAATGYIMLGGLVSIFLNKLARRA
jgi:uncharacterized protein YjbI with pentapeptide repeats